MTYRANVRMHIFNTDCPGAHRRHLAGIAQAQRLTASESRRLSCKAIALLVLFFLANIVCRAVVFPLASMDDDLGGRVR